MSGFGIGRKRSPVRRPPKVAIDSFEYVAAGIDLSVVRIMVTPRRAVELNPPFLKVVADSHEHLFSPLPAGGRPVGVDKTTLTFLVPRPLLDAERFELAASAWQVQLQPPALYGIEDGGADEIAAAVLHQQSELVSQVEQLKQLENTVRRERDEVLRLERELEQARESFNFSLLQQRTEIHRVSVERDDAQVAMEAQKAVARVADDERAALAARVAEIQDEQEQALRGAEERARQLSVRLESQDMEVRRTAIRLSAAEGDLGESRRLLDQQTREIEELGRKLTAARSEITLKTEQLDQTREALQISDRSVAERSAEVDRLTAELSQATEALAAERATIDTERLLRTESDARASELDEDVRRLSEQLERATDLAMRTRREADAARDSADDRHSELEAARFDLRHARTAAEQTAAELSSTADALDQHRIEAAEARTQLQSTNAALDQARSEVANLKSELAGVHERLADATDRIERERAQRMESERRAAELVASDRAKAIAVEAGAERERRLLTELEGARTRNLASAEAERELRAEVAANESSIAELQQCLAAREAELEAERAGAERIREEARASAEARDVAQARLLELDRRLDVAGQEERALREDLARRQADFEEQERLRVEAETRVQAAEAELESRREELDQRKAQFEASESAQRALMEQVAEAEKALEQLRAGYEARGDDLAQARAAADDLTARYEGARERFDEAVAANERLSVEETARTQEIESMRSELEAAKAGLEEREGVEQEVASLRAHLAQREEELREWRGSNERLSAEHEERSREVDSVRAQLDETTTRLTAIGAELEQAGAERERLEHELAGLHEQLAAAGSHREEELAAKDRLAAEHEARGRELGSQLEGTSEQLAESAAQRERAEMELAGLRVRLQQREQELLTANDTLAAERAKSDRLAAEVANGRYGQAPPAPPAPAAQIEPVSDELDGSQEAAPDPEPQARETMRLEEASDADLVELYALAAGGADLEGGPDAAWTLAVAVVEEASRRLSFQRNADAEAGQAGRFKRPGQRRFEQLCEAVVAMNEGRLEGIVGRRLSDDATPDPGDPAPGPDVRLSDASDADLAEAYSVARSAWDERLRADDTLSARRWQTAMASVVAEALRRSVFTAPEPDASARGRFRGRKRQRHYDELRAACLEATSGAVGTAGGHPPAE